MAKASASERPDCILDSYWTRCGASLKQRRQLLWSHRMEQPIINVVDVFQFHKGIIVGLYVEGCQRFPLVVGCSIRSPNGEVLDVPARVLKSPGLALWALDAPVECAKRETGSSQVPEWRGDIIFALWPDFSFSKRLADTGWVQWSTPWLIGASLAGVRAQEDEIGRKYGHRTNVWAERSEFSPEAPPHEDESVKLTVLEALQLLGLTNGATEQQIRSAYREQVKKYHPDRVADLADEFKRLAEIRTRKLNRAYEILDPRTRA